MKTLFHEIYSAYYSAVGEILRRAVRGELSRGELQHICREKAFAESFLTIVPALTGGRWQLLRPDMSTPLRNEPQPPLSLLERRWLKAISLDPKMALFGLDWGFLGEVKPLFTPEDIVVFDRYEDGDPFTDPHYIRVFRTALAGIRSGMAAEIDYHSAKGKNRRFRCRLTALEYSGKDDKFRLLVSGCRNIDMVLLSGIERIALSPAIYPCKPLATAPEPLCIEADLTDDRNGLERAMLHFSHYERETTHLTGNRYKLKIYYSPEDETELVIRVLSFGPLMRVYSPDSFVEEIRARLQKQYELGIR
ncbi:MAG: WYL domain-containing protein [Oscillospiraceae bacterium]